MKSKKILLGALMALAIGTSAFNLFGADENPDEQCKWIINSNCICVFVPSYPSKGFCDFESCAAASKDCNPR